MMSGFQFIRLQSRFGGNAGVLSQAATEAKTVLEFKDEIHLIWSASPERATDINAKDYRKRRLQTCVGQRQTF